MKQTGIMISTASCCPSSWRSGVVAAALLLWMSIASVLAGEGGYLFVTFKGESPDGEQVYFALSQDGKAWSALNQSKPVLTSQIGEKGARDPFLLRRQNDGKFVLIATDECIFRKRIEVGNGPGTWKKAREAGSRSLVIWESTDLVHWNGPRLVAVAPKDAGCAWAPEAIYDPAAGDYLVFWASTTAADHFKKHRVWSCHTRDFRDFSPPAVFIDRDSGTIDTTIVHEGGLYYRFSKDETRKAIIMESSPRLVGTWQEVSGFSLAATMGIEGPECFPLYAGGEGTPQTWCLIVDAYAKSLGYQPYLTQDLAKGIFTKGEGFVFPFKFRHGAVLPISGEEFTRLQAAFPAKGAKP